MKLSANSLKLLDFFIENKCLIHKKQTNKTDNLIKGLYYDMKHAFTYVNNIKLKQGQLFNKINIKHITFVSQIPRPSIFPANSFPDKIRSQIDDNILTELFFTTQFINRNIKIYFLLEEHAPNVEKYITYAEYMLVWLKIIDDYASKTCANELTIYIYHTSLTKQLPNTSLVVLGEENVNTAFTTTCPKKSEIVVFRKEEWFKVFIHETFHNFGLDFSGMNNEEINKCILSIFQVKTDVNLYESYTEFWARIMNALFCSYFSLPKHANENTIMEIFLTNSEFFINMEINFSCFQMVKVLDFMGLNYTHFLDKSKTSQEIRNTLYKEDTSVLAYYVITYILMTNYQPFLEWCHKNNTSFLQFKNTTSNQLRFCEFIHKNHNTKELLKNIQCVRKFLKKLQNARKYNTKISLSSINYILNNLRMTICELY
jgi:hypothetical protein